MNHLNDIELIESSAGNLAEPRASEVREHIAACPECSRGVQEAGKLWSTLGRWQADSAGHSVVDRVMASAHEDRARSVAEPSTLVLRKRFVLQALRVAASILIAVGLGHKLGRYSVAGQEPSVAASQSKPEYLAALGLEWSSGLAWLVLNEGPAETGAEQ